MLLFFFLTLALAVQTEIFKTCQTSGFCHRNSHLRDAIELLGSSYVPKYRIVSSSVSFDGVISGKILKSLPDSTIDLSFKLALTSDSVRFTIDEPRPSLNTVVNHARYNETELWAFASTLPIDKIDPVIEKDSTYFEFEDYKIELNYYPIKLTVFSNSKPIFSVNNDNLLNLEHFRLKNQLNQQNLEESDFNLFNDDFIPKDSLPLGPESIGLDFTFHGFNNVFGIPEHADSFNLKDTTDSEPYRLFNIDIFEYETNSRHAMYGSIPLIMASKQDISLGLFWINSADTYINIKKEPDSTKTHWISENGIIDFIIIIDKSIQGINKKYGKITGFTPIPQLFSLGYHQCRWNYNDEKDLMDVHNNFDLFKIPYDTIWLDIEYTDEKKYFTWDNEAFPNHKKIIKTLDQTGRNLVVIIDPHLKTNYFLSNELIEKNLVIKDSDLNSFKGDCWPGESVYIDTLNLQSRKVWNNQFTWNNDFFGGDSNNIHLWNDMNEPSVFGGPEAVAPKDTIHFGNWEHRSVHNLYGMSYHQATYEALKLRNEGHGRERPFILTRSFFAGSQRSAAMWTGDNTAKWEYLKASIPMLLTLNVAGFPFAGSDVGGFFGNPTPELLARWFQAGVWYPFFRGHANIDADRREPWIFGEPYTSIIRDAIKLRYTLLPVFYTSFYETSISGSPVMKPIFYETSDNQDSYLIDDQFFIGNSGLLVKPITEENGENVKIYLPNTETYYDFTNGKVGESYKLSEPGYIEQSVTLNDIPALIKGGSIVPRKERYRRSSKLMYNDPYTLYVAYNNEGKASGKLYIDDGESFNYENGKYIHVEFTADKSGISTNVIGDKDYGQSIKDVVVEKIVLISETLSIDKVSITQGKTRNGEFVTEGDNQIIIKNPKVRINESWRIDFESSIDHDEL